MSNETNFPNNTRTPQSANIPVESLSPFTRFCCSLGMIPSSYKASMSYEEQLMWLCDYLENTVIPTVNNNTDVTNEVQDLFNQLHDYVENYFTNLDVQQEINNKLDEMASDGSLISIIAPYLQPFIDEQNQTIANAILSQNGKITQLENFVYASTNINPLIASSIEQMTDTTRIYVNTTNGYWYFWDGTAWTPGGVYQASQISDNSINYNKLSNLIKNNSFREVHAEDLIWFDKIGMYMGSLTNNAEAFTSTPVLIPKGNSITISSSMKCRILQFDLNKAFVRQTGSYAIQSKPWIADDDCYVRISVSQIDSEHPLSIADLTNTNISFTGLIPLSLGDLITNNLQFKRHTDDLVIESQPIYCGKGTKISINEFNFTNDSSNPSGQMFNLGISLSDVYSSPASASLTNSYTTQSDGFVKIKIRLNKLGTSTSLEITDEMIPKLKNIIEIAPTLYNTISSAPSTYVSSNREIKIINNYNSNGSNLIRINGLVVRNASVIIADLSIENIEEQLSSNVVEYNQENYIRIPAYQGLIYDLNTKSLKIISLNLSDMPFISDNIIYLALNAYAFFFDGIFIEQWTRQQLNKLNNELSNISSQIIPIFNSSTVPSSYDWKTKAKQFTEIFKSIDSTNIESFVFFTDQHLMGINDSIDYNVIRDFINKLQIMYNSIPASFIVDGGDWLQAQDSQENACFKLGYIDGFMRSMFKNYYPINGNHDTNYQGVVNPGETWTGILQTNVTTNLRFRNYGKNYYKFAGKKSMNYVLDSVLEINDTMTDYKWEQIDWLANQLLEDDFPHATVLIHIVWRITDPVTVSIMADNVTKLINAYNNHSIITLNSKTYDFTNKEGHVDYVLSGHTHADMNNTINGVLCVSSINFRSGNVPSYDLIINDYDNHKLRMIRVGTGNNREFNI